MKQKPTLTILFLSDLHPLLQEHANDSVRVVRMLKHNDRWAAKLEKQRQRREARETRIAEQKKKEADADAERARRELSSNPFSMSGKGTTPSLFGNGSLFDAKPAETPAPQKEEQKEAQENDDDDDDDYDEDERLAEELAIKASLEEQRAQLGTDKDWARTAARYTPALYLNTIPEPARNVEAAEQPSKATLARAQETGADMDEGDEEEYEQMTVEGMDTIFERFTARLGSEARQVVRYEYDGTPLPFSGAGSVYKKLWPNGQYTAQSVPPCEKCGAPRVFEVQLMPNLANLLRADRLEGLGERAGGDSEAQRRAEIASTLGLPMDADASQMPTGIVWSTVFVFVCSKDCTPSPAEGWAEEWAGVQFEGEL